MSSNWLSILTLGVAQIQRNPRQLLESRRVARNGIGERNKRCGIGGTKNRKRTQRTHSKRRRQLQSIERNQINRRHLARGGARKEVRDEHGGPVGRTSATRRTTAHNNRTRRIGFQRLGDRIDSERHIARQHCPVGGRLNRCNFARILLLCERFRARSTSKRSKSSVRLSQQRGLVDC